MAATYIVKNGESLAEIIYRHGFSSWRTVYENPSNSKLRQKRQNPNVLASGDKIVLPDKRIKHVNVITETRRRFLSKQTKCIVRIYIKDSKDRAHGNKMYRLNIEGIIFSGKSDSSGLIQHLISPNAKQATLEIWFNSSTSYPSVTWKFEIGSLDPSEDIKGMQGRLMNLGYFSGFIDGELTPETKLALLRYQADHGLTPHGSDDATTRMNILQRHNNT